MSEDKYLVFYKDAVNQFHCYYPQTKEYVIRNTPDYDAHRFELMSDYSIDDGIKKVLKRYSKDIKVWIKECKEDEYNIDYLKRYKPDSKYYNTIMSMCEQTFNRFCGKWDRQFDEIDKIEGEWIEKCYNAGIMNCKPTENHIQCYGYDFKSSYLNDLCNITFSTKKGEEKFLSKLPKKDKLQHGYYRVNIKTIDEEDNTYEDSTIRMLFSFSKKNVYNEQQLKYALELKEKYKQLKVKLIVDSEPNCYVYKDEDLINGRNVFYRLKKALNEMRTRHPKNKLIKTLGTRLWGCLTKQNIIRKTVQEIEDENINFNTGEYEFKDQIYNPDNTIKYIEMYPKNKPFKHNMRIKSHITSYGRYKIARVVEDDIKNVIRVQTDNVTFKTEHKELECELLQLEAKTTGLIRWENVNHYYHLCLKCNKEYKYKNGHEC